MAQKTQETVINGVDVPRLTETLRAIRGDPGLASFRFNLRNRWLGLGHNRSLIREFHGARQDHRTGKEPFVLDNDEPEVLLGEDQAPNPVEYVLHALAGCLTSTLVYHAAARGIRIESIESELKGEIDIQGFLGLSDDIRKGYQNIEVTLRVKSDASAEQLEELATYSPVRDTLANPVPVHVTVEKSD